MSDIYIPPNAFDLSKAVAQQIRLGIQGPPGEGKTTAALTFPNCLVYNLNRGLGGFAGRKDIHEIPAWNIEFVKKYFKGSINVRDFTIFWLENEATKLTEEQTLIIDALGDLEAAHDRWEAKNPTYTNKGKLDEYADWRNKVTFFADFDSCLKGLKCHVVLCSHETKDRQAGELTGKVRPILTGLFGDKIAGCFTDWFRQLAKDKLPPEKVTDDILSKFMMSRSEFLAWQDTFPRHTIYLWQLESDDIFSGKCSSLINFPRYMPSNYDSFMKYKRKFPVE